MQRRIGFLGLGKMGLPMAGHLAANGHALSGYDPAADRQAAAQAAGLQVAARADELVTASPILVSSLPNDDALEATAQLIAAHARSRTVYIDTSTVSIEASARAAAVLEAANVVYLRCTVSGNNHMAESAQLTMMVSGSRDAYEDLGAVFNCWGGTCFYLGEGEQARLMKLVINLMIMLTSGMLAEALTLGRKGGLAWADMWQVIAASAVASPIVKAKAAPLGQRDFSATFTVEQMRKDVRLILDAGATLNVPLSLAALAAQWLSSAAAQGDSDSDYAAVIRVIERASALGSDPVSME